MKQYLLIFISLLSIEVAAINVYSPNQKLCLTTDVDNQSRICYSPDYRWGKRNYHPQ